MAEVMAEKALVVTDHRTVDCRWCVTEPAAIECKGLCSDCHERQLRMLRSRAAECRVLHTAPLTREAAVEVKRRLTSFTNRITGGVV